MSAPSAVSPSAPSDFFRSWEVGDTPILEIRGISGAVTERVRLFAKAEWFNPGGSIKDRAALSMLLEGRARGALTAGKTVLDATSGNTGVAYSWIGARLGCPVRLAVPASINAERRRILLAYGAELVETDPLEGSDGAIREAKRIFSEEPARYFYPDQYSNPANWKAHYETTAPEIWEQTRGEVTHFVAGLGTSGTFTGAGRRLRELKPNVRLVSVEPDAPFHGLEGLKHMATSIVPSIHDPRLADEKLSVSTEEAQDWVRRLARERGILAGVSSGAALAAALRVCRQLSEEGRPGVVVAVFPDGGERYLSERFWGDAG